MAASEHWGERGRDFTHRNFIAGRWSASSETQPNNNPSDSADTVGQYAPATIAEVEEAIASARMALPRWSGTNIQARADVLRRIGDSLLTNAATLGRMLAREEGKLLGEATAEVIRSAQIFHFFSGEAVRMHGETGPSLRDGIAVSVSREPVGVVALITPWNFPMAVPAWKVAAALAYGNTVVLKPSEYTPACAVALTEIAIAAGVPAGVLNLMLGRGADMGDALLRDVDALSFTGSTPVGRALLTRSASHMTKVQLELGGKNALLILDDADLQQALYCAVEGSFMQTGQRCTASSRIIVTRRMHDRFVEALVQRVSSLRAGGALDANVDLGPVANPAQLQRNLHCVAEAEREGAQRLCGGERIESKTGALLFQPAILVGTHGGMQLNREEIFGPVVGVIQVEDIEEGIAVANQADYALSAGVCTQDLRAAELFRRSVRAGMVMINAPTAGVDYHAPFGGRAPSAYGAREQGTVAAEFFTEIKTTYLNHGVK